MSGKPNFEGPLNLKHYIIQTMVRTHNPLSISQLMESAIRQGYTPRGAEPEKYLRRILIEDPIFIQDNEELWSLNIQNVDGFNVVIGE